MSDFLSVKKNGYSVEEAYFHKVNQKLIQDIRRGIRKHTKVGKRKGRRK